MRQCSEEQELATCMQGNSQAALSCGVAGVVYAEDIRCRLFRLCASTHCRQHACAPQAYHIRLHEPLQKIRLLCPNFDPTRLPKRTPVADTDGTEAELKLESNTKEDGSGQGCSICCDKLQHDVWGLACGHMFHGQCLARVCERQMECPVCRQEIAGESDLRRLYPN